MSAAPASRSVTAGQSTAYGVTVSPLNGYSGSGTYSVTGLPAGASGTFTPASFANGSYASTLAVATTALTAAGSYPVTITAAEGGAGLSRSTQVTLGVTAPVVPDFTISVSPTSRNVRAGNSTSFTIAITRTGAFSQDVSLSVSGLPSGFTSSFSPHPASGTSSTLAIKTPKNVKSTYALTITAPGGGITRTASVSPRTN